MPAPSWAPTHGEVAALIPQRVLTASGDTIGTFGATSIPTDTQVTAIIADVCYEILAGCGTIPSTLEDLAKATAKAGAAAQVELAFFPSEPDSAYENLKALYESRRGILCPAVAAGSGAGADETPLAQYNFPVLADNVETVDPVYVTSYQGEW
jgi:hypothetical protein